MADLAVNNIEVLGTIFLTSNAQIVNQNGDVVVSGSSGRGIDDHESEYHQDENGEEKTVLEMVEVAISAHLNDKHGSTGGGGGDGGDGGNGGDGGGDGGDGGNGGGGDDSETDNDDDDDSLPLSYKEKLDEIYSALTSMHEAEVKTLRAALDEAKHSIQQNMTIMQDLASAINMCINQNTTPSECLPPPCHVNSSSNSCSSSSCEENKSANTVDNDDDEKNVDNSNAININIATHPSTSTRVGATADSHAMNKQDTSSNRNDLYYANMAISKNLALRNLHGIVSRMINDVSKSAQRIARLEKVAINLARKTEK